ncbi:MAG: hypothetical protein EP329_10780 [Deltaproteobacteria bacterium]|nr:MAG: hypothetical protein EP329_10780 [Deltaproteobacteria bacterium]
MCRRGVVIAWAATIVLGGCLESRPGTAAGDVTADVGTDGDVGAGAVPACANPTATVASRGDSERTPWQIVTLSSHEILFSGDSWMYGEDPGIWRLDVGAGAVERVAETGDEDVLVDARDGALLVLRPQATPADRRLFYVDDAGAVELVGAPDRFWGYPEYGERGHYVAPRLAAWRSCEYDDQGRCVRSQLRAWRDGEVVTLWAHTSDPAITTPPLPEVTGAEVLWTEAVVADDGTTTSYVRTWSGGEVTLLRSIEGHLRRVMRVGDALLWLTDDGVWRATGDGPATQLSARWCGSAYTDGERAVMLCQDPERTNTDNDGLIDASWSPFPGGTGDLWLYAGGPALVRVPSEGAVRAVPVVDGGVFAWVTYDDVDAGCYPPSAGTVWAAPVAAPDRAVAVGDIGAGCYCCDSIWPDLRLSLRDGLLAWNYGQVPAEEPPYDPRGGYLSWARVRVTCD